MSSITLNGDTSGSVQIAAPAVSGSTTVTLPGSGSTNTTYGYQTPTTGSNNTAIGYQALTLSTAGSCTAVGFSALGKQTSPSNFNDAFGYNSLGALTTGNVNLAVGNNAGSTITTGNGNIVVGYNSGSSLTTGTNNIYLGYNLVASGAAVTNEIVIGTNNQTGKGSNTGFINGGNGGVYQGNNSASWSTTSDQRIKENIVPVSSGLSILAQLNPVTFDYIITKKSDVGFIAQEFQTVLPDQVQTHVASPEEKELTGSDTLYGITPNLIPYLVKAIQELSAKVTALEAKVGA